MMGRSMICAAVLVLMLVPAPVPVIAAVDNVAFQWTDLLSTLMCSQFAAPLTAGIQQQLHLAQWHSLLALRGIGGGTTEEAVVAYASWKILGHYFSFAQVLDLQIGPLLDTQLREAQVTLPQQILAQRIGETVAMSMIARRGTTSSEFTLGAVKRALKAAARPPPTGVFRFFDDSPAGQDAATFFFSVMTLWRPFVIPDPVVFVETYLANLRPPKIPSKEWDDNWEGLKNIGRLDWPGRTAEMNLTANLIGCPRVNNNKCHFEQQATAAAQSALPNGTSLYDSVLLLAKISVTQYDAGIAQSILKYGFWFWRPSQAYQEGDSKHAPIPNWTPFLPTPLEPEWPSGTVTFVSAGARPLQTFIGSGKKVSFTIEGGGTFDCEGFVGDPVPTRSYPSLEAFVKEAQLSRMYAGAHFQDAVNDGVVVGNTVADYVESHWGQVTPSGTLPDLAFLNVMFTVPNKTGDFTPRSLDVK
ncbi:hypothetical protein M758_1G075600 [Ceratodon purpureus]|uniref:Vanadium-dependent haloperoxidase NapH1-like second helical-bundle domain-containing protein n=1 Tax=Ceratodon purpureus TaxID=3225 RepID=A0A8T0J4U8_CERPU|nr:hypothetical protein KC19_1G077500 [Ceratodon purpureus]KAG0629085.1 hypothetical protein M758_1G075600 [Ceratodon purpureus]